MARKVTISKEIILSTALQMLIEDRYQSISIHTLAKRIGCSTQPIAWHFENMEGLRRELYAYALLYEQSKTELSHGDGVKDFSRIGSRYITTAMKEPNLFKFLYLGEGPVSRPYSLADMPKGKVNDELIRNISEQTGLSIESAAKVVHNTIVYSHGVATMIATGVFKTTKKDAMELITNASEAFVMKERSCNG